MSSFSPLESDRDSICALATPSGHSGIAVIRTSGEAVYKNLKENCHFLPAEIQSHRAHFGLFKDAKTKEAIDQVVVLSFAKGRSYTGEESCEISCHGNPLIIANLLQALIGNGFRMAKPGEFTYRAFMNGKLDLAQAEGVLSLIESQSKELTKISLRQVQGQLSQVYQRIESEILLILAHLEASIDFSDQELVLEDHLKLAGRANAIQQELDILLNSYSQSAFLRDGLRVVLIGPPNVGKSSLLNALSGQEKAIVTEEPGTTRDLVETDVRSGANHFYLVDTAGLRSTEGLAERIGIERSRSAAADADLRLGVFEMNAWQNAIEMSTEFSFDMIVVNKIDLNGSTQARHQWHQSFSKLPIFFVSVKTAENISNLREALFQLSVDKKEISVSTPVLQARHFELLKRCRSGIDAAMRLLEQNASPEFVSFELQMAVESMHELLGKRFNEQVIDRIFQEFCLGK